MAALFALIPITLPAQEAPDAASAQSGQSDPEAERLLKAVADKLSKIKALRVDAEFRNRTPAGQPFHRAMEIALMRDFYIRVTSFNGVMTDSSVVTFDCDGKTVWTSNPYEFIMDRRPMRRENFHLGNGFAVQYFFVPKLEFNPQDQVWNKPMDLFETNRQAYNRNVTKTYLGTKRHLGEKVRMVQVRYNSQTDDIKQVFYINEQDFISQVDTYWSGYNTFMKSELYRNYRVDEALTPEQFAYTPPEKMPVRASDPVRLGEIAPDFELPLNTGGNIKLSELLKTKKAVLVVTLDGTYGSGCHGPDAYLPQMRIMQQVRDKFAKQGLEVVAVVGDDSIVPENKEKMLKFWLPDQTRFSYPIAIDLDLERGIQGSAYHNFQLNGHNNILLDKDGRVVFACNDFNGDRNNELALYNALAEIGFAVSAADRELEKIDKLYSIPGQ